MLVRVAVVDGADDLVLWDRVVEGATHVDVVEGLHVGIKLEPDRIRGIDRVDRDRVDPLERLQLTRLKELRNVDRAALQKGKPARRSGHFLHDDALHGGLVAPVIVTRLEHGLLAPHQLLQSIGPKPGAIVLEELHRPRVVLAADLGAFGPVIDGVGEIALLLEQDRVRLVEVERNGVVVFDLDLIGRMQAQHALSGTGPVP